MMRVRRALLASVLVAAVACDVADTPGSPDDGVSVDDGTNIDDGASGDDVASLDEPAAEAADAPDTDLDPAEGQPAGERSPSGSDGDADETEPDAGAEEPAAPERPEPHPGPPSDERTLEHVTTIRGDIAPKSVVSSGTGRFFAQNMMYRHTITVYDDAHELVATIPDTVELTEFGIDHDGGEVQGSPVEAAFSPDGRYAYVSNYKMYGPGYTNGGTDTCSPADGYDDSFVYRVDVDALEIDQVIGVGAVPKYVATTPDGRYVLVSNWCSYDVSVIDVEQGREVERIDVGRYPRGLAVTADSSTAYVAVMGSYDVAELDLDMLDVTSTTSVGNAPRHLVLDPDERFLYVTLNGEGVVARVDLSSGEVVRVRTGEAPRSMDISADGRALYVVNYHGNTVTKVRTSDMSVLQTIDVDPQPIGITYDVPTAEVWVAHYSGSIRVYADR